MIDITLLTGWNRAFKALAPPLRRVEGVGLLECDAMGPIRPRRPRPDGPAVRQRLMERLAQVKRVDRGILEVSDGDDSGNALRATLHIVLGVRDGYEMIDVTDKVVAAAKELVRARESPVELDGIVVYDPQGDVVRRAKA